MMQSWLILLASLLAGVNAGPLKLSGDCATRILVTKSKNGTAPPLVAALSKECQAKWSSELAKMIECLQMAASVESLITGTTGEAVLLQRIVIEISAYKYVQVIQNGVIEGWGTIQQFIECQAPQWIAADCRARYDLLQPITYPFLSTSIQTACFIWMDLNEEESYNCTSLSGRIARLIHKFYDITPFTLKLVAEELQKFKTSAWNANFIETTIIGGWGTLQQFIDCPAPVTTSGSAKGVNITLPSSWTYPPKGYPAGPGQQTKEVAESNIKLALDTAKTAMEKENKLMIIDLILLYMPTGIEMLDFEKRNITDYASFGGTVAMISSEGNIAGACVKRVQNKCTTESEFEFGAINYPRVIISDTMLKGEETTSKSLTAALAKALLEQGIQVVESDIHS